MTTYDADGFFDIGLGHWLRWLPDGNLLWRDPNCRAANFVDVTSGKRHRVTKGSKEAPPVLLKLEGSLLCPQGCGAHGHVIDGKWVQA